MKILLATSNDHKRDEILSVWRGQAGFEALGVELVLLGDLGMEIEEPVEDQDTFEGNAVLKARYYAQAAGLTCIADDSGLEVDALGGEPGVYSARYSGVTGGRGVVDPANNRLLMEKLEGVKVEDRVCRFVCAMAMCSPPGSNPEENDEPAAVVRGEVVGRVLLAEEAADVSKGYAGRGSNGFGYDPIFYLPERGVTIAELSAEDKNAISHRGEAARMMYGYLQKSE